MTRKDYVLIAKAFAEAAESERFDHREATVFWENNPELAPTQEMQRIEDLQHYHTMNGMRDVAIILCQTLAMDNPRFESERFLEAATLRVVDMPKLMELANAN